MDIHLAIISIIEGVTEFLPISSTAHLIIASKFLNVDTADAYIKFYLLFIQFGALLAGILLFGKRVLTDKKTFVNIAISFVPSAVFGFLLYTTFKHLLEGNMLLLSLMLFVGGLVFIYLEHIFMKEKGNDFGVAEITTKDAFIVGVAQALAIIPGVSRSGATIVAGILRNIKKSVIIEYTFLLALPTLGAAVIYDAYKSREMLGAIVSYSGLLWGFVISFIMALITLKILKDHLPKISLTAFGWYRIAVSLVVFSLFVV